MAQLDRRKQKRQKPSDRRDNPRQDVSKNDVRARLVFKGGSLLKKENQCAFELDAKAMNVSESGICLSLISHTPWVPSYHDEVNLYLEDPEGIQNIKGKLIRKNENGTISMEFSKPAS